MSEAAQTTTETQQPKTTEATIHDAVDALFAEKSKAAEPPKPKEAPAAAAEPAEAKAETKTEPVEASPAEGETAEEETATEEAPAETKPEPEKVSATDYALELARARKRLAKTTTPAPTAQTPSAEAIELAAKMQAAGADPVKRFEAAGLNLADVVKAYEKEVLEGNAPDPLADEVKRLNQRIEQLETDRMTAETVQTKREFFSAAERFVAANESKFARVKAMGQKALDIVEHMVIQQGQQNIVLPLVKALEMVEDHYREIDEQLATTRPQPKPQTKKPSIPQQAPLASAAPTAPTKPLTVSDVIDNELDALLAR